MQNSGAMPVYKFDRGHCAVIRNSLMNAPRGNTREIGHGTVCVGASVMKSTLVTLSLFTALFLYTAQSSHGAGPDADNSANNKTDRDTAAVTPEKQSNAEADVKVTREIRRAIVNEKSLSVYAHNLKIITTMEHVVYLRGAVSSADDVSKIVSLAEKSSSGYPVKNQISVSSSK